MKLTPTFIAITVVFVLWATPAVSQETDAPAPPRREIAVAVLDFAATDVTTEDLGGILGETVEIMLTGQPGFRLVDRASIDRIIAEQELNLTGMVETDQAVKIGQLVGARIIVTGRAFALGKRTFLTAKIIGTETSLVDGVLVKADSGANLDELVVELAEKVAEKLAISGPALVASDDAVDPLPGLIEALKGHELPAVAVVVLEEHFASARPEAAAPDPAVETEIKQLLREAGFTVVDVDQNALADWARQTPGQLADGTWPQSLSRADVVIVGEAFSEFAGRLNNLISAAARAEINVISRDTGEIVLADRATTRAIDLAENIAGKTALQKAGRTLGLNVLTYYAEQPKDAEAEE